VKFPLKLCFVEIKALQLDHELSDVLVGEATVSHELCPILAGHRFIRRVEDVLFQLRVQIKLGKDLLRKQMLGAKMPGALISSKEIFDLPMIGFKQGDGIDRVLRLIAPVYHGMLSLSPALGSGTRRVGVGMLLCKLYAIEETVSDHERARGKSIRSMVRRLLPRRPGVLQQENPALTSKI
jgi:hypothetical protein